MPAWQPLYDWHTVYDSFYIQSTTMVPTILLPRLMWYSPLLLDHVCRLSCTGGRELLGCCSCKTCHCDCPWVPTEHKADNCLLLYLSPAHFHFRLHPLQAGVGDILPHALPSLPGGGGLPATAAPARALSGGGFPTLSHPTHAHSLQELTASSAAQSSHTNIAPLPSAPGVCCMAVCC